MKKLLIFFVAAISFAGCNSPASKPEETEEMAATAGSPGKIIFTKNCKLCHGADGTLGVSGAANLSISVLSKDEKIKVITDGRRGMAPWKGQLTPEEILLVADYVETLSK